jgi:E3 ubiquitin-protein ligase BAH
MRPTFTKHPEFDKRTQLGSAAKTFPKLIRSDPIMSESMAKDMCAQVTQDIVKIVPQLDDYSCPICSDVIWRPVKLRCEHVLCSACAVKLEKENRRKPTKACPLCRKNVVVDLKEGMLFSLPDMKSG